MSDTAKALDITDHIDVRDGTIADMVLQGLAYSDIAKALGIGKSTVSRRLSKPITRQIIETAIAALALHAPKVCKNLIALTEDEDHNVRLKAIAEYTKIMGLSHAHASVVIQAMYVDQRSQVLTAGMVSILGGQAAQGDVTTQIPGPDAASDGVIDIEAE